MTEAGKPTAEYLDAFDDGVEARAAADRDAVAEAIAAERARIAAAVKAEMVDVDRDDIGDPADAADAGWNDALAAVLRIIEGETP